MGKMSVDDIALWNFYVPCDERAMYQEVIELLVEQLCLFNREG